jgi:hypothetical protein
MKISHLTFAAIAAFSGTLSHADTRNPFDPASAAKVPVEKQDKARGARSMPPGTNPVAPFPQLPPVLPPPLPAARPPAAATMPAEVEEPTERKKRSKSTQMQATAAACQLRVKSESVAAPAYGGLVTISLQGGSKSCVSAVMVEQSWLEVQELTDPDAIRIEVDANESSTPRQSNIVIANAGRSVSVTLVQEGRTPRGR